MAYNRHNWDTGEPITAAKMNNMENGIANTTSVADANTIKIGYTSEEITAGGSIKQRLSTLSNTVSTLGGQIDANFRSDLEAVKTQVNDARGSLSLAQTLQVMRDATATVSNNVQIALLDINGAHRTTGDTLKARFEAIEAINGNQQTAISALTKDITDAAQGEDSLDINLTNIKNSIYQMNTELKAGDNTTSLQVKLKNLSDRIVTEQGRITSANTQIDNIKTTLGYAVSGTPSQTVKQIIESNASIAQTQSNNAENRAKQYTDIQILQNNNNLDTHFTNIENNINTIASELNMLEGSTIKNTNTRIDNIEDSINNSTSGLAATKAIADEALTKANNAVNSTTVSNIDNRLTSVENDLNTETTGLKARVTALENAPETSATKVINNVSYNPNGIPINIGETPSSDIDYLLKNGDKYYYWKYINNNWELISGAGNEGTSSAEFYSSLMNVANPSETVDYFIGSDMNYTHYRYLNDNWVTILPNHLINYVSVDSSAVTGEVNSATKSRPIIREMGSEINLLADFKAIQDFSADPVEGGYKLTWTNIDGEVQDVVITGGGGSNTNVNTTITRVTEANVIAVSGETCQIEFIYNAVDNSGEQLAITGLGTWYINRARVATSDVKVGTNSFDITPYLQNGVNDITLNVTISVNDTTVSSTKTWSIDVKNFSLVWDYDESTINAEEQIKFSYVPYGADISKTLHLEIDGFEYVQSVLTSGIPTTIILNNSFSHGTHTAEMWMTASINEIEKETKPHIRHDFIVAREDDNTTIIAATLPNTEMNQYDILSIPFVVYDPSSMVSTVTLSVNDVIQDTREVGRTIQTWNYNPSTEGEKVLTITANGTTKVLNLNVNKIDINNEEINDYSFKLKASELASNNALKNWYYDANNQLNTKIQFSDNFDWVNGGIQSEIDENGQLRQYIKVKSGTTMTIPYKIFATDPRINGSNFKIIFKVENCRDYDATIASNISDNIGIQLNAHKATFKSTTTEISTQYGEEEYTELEFEVYKALQANGSNATNPFMIAWVDGVMATARPYGGNFVQNNAMNFVIGSNDCDVCIYLVKYYPFVLNRADHITNFISDAPNASEMIKRYNRNNILDVDGEIDYNLLAKQNKDCRVWLYDIERMTKAKDDAINVNSFQQIWENGDQYYQLKGTNAKLKIQGTSSFNYRYGAANTDIDFGKKKAPDATLIDGYGNNLLDNSLEYQGFKINDNSLPITYSNTKVNFASCEQVNNMCNAEWYQRYQPFPSLSARDCMEFAMGVQFIKDRHQNEPADGIVLFNEKGSEFNPEKYYMYSVANMGTSKKNTHIFHSENECCIEIKENTSDAQKMKSFDSTWTDNDDNTQNYEMRYPDLKPTAVTNDIKNGWARFVTWMAESNPSAATGAELLTPVEFEPYTFRGHNREIIETEGRNFSQVLRGVTVSQYAGTYTHDTFEYRMAKMLSECEDYMVMDSVIYHFCFIERHTMVDNVAKNTFWSSLKEIGGPNNEEGYWIWDLSKNYDNDTSDGNNNNGLLVFDYGNEATDTRDGTPVFNGHDAVWFVFASNLYEACRAMFINRESVGAWDSVAYHNYLTTEQHKVPERVWNECYWYDYLRTYENNIETTWINFLDGGQKIHQRKHYETYEEIYDSSKYRGSFSHNQSITLRGEAIDYQGLGLPAQESKFTITMFNKCYLTIWIGTNYQTVKCEKEVPVTLSFYEDNDPSKGYMRLSNSVIDIDSGSMVQAIGDLSLIYPSSGQFGNAKRLRSLQIGSDVAGYYNPNMNNNSILTFNNKMLEYLYVQNLPQATYNLDLSNCSELKLLNAAGSGFTGFIFANGGLLNEAYINTPNSLVMRNLNVLTNENFHITNPAAVTLLRLENCTQFDKLTFVNELTNLNVLRLTNIDWTLNDNTILDKLLNMKGIDESGFTVDQSYLSGTVALTGTVYEGIYNNYMNAWSPDLIIDTSNSSFINQYLVTYYNENGDKIYETYIDSGNYLTDPYAEGTLNEPPTKAADVQYSYIFGTLDNASNYIPFSGWRFSNESESIYSNYGRNPMYQVNNSLELYAVYSTSPQRYIVRWLLDTNKVVYSTPAGQNYGGGYNLIAPTIQDVQQLYPTYSFTSSGNTCSYRIMTGWNKLPTNITPTNIGVTYDIYATWLERNNVNYQTVLNNDEYSVEEKLLVLKEMPAARATISLSDKYNIQLGYKGQKPAIDLLSSPKRYIGTTDTINDYTPFGVNKSFTLMIDYRFEKQFDATKDEAVLISCYSDNNGSVQGFKLFYDPDPRVASPVPQISFGSTAQQSSSNIHIIGSSIDNRGVVVLRHPARDSNLYVYSGSSGSGLIADYSGTTVRKAISWSSNPSDAKIVLGGININDTSIMNATGTLYAVKYWEEDLGEGECLQLANWCHETISLAVADFKEADTHSSINALNSSIVFHTLNASEMGNIAEPALNINTDLSIGWNPSTIRNFYNNRIYQSLPILLQSIITPVTVPYRKSDYTDGRYVIRKSGVDTISDYIFAPSCVEVGASGDTVSNHIVEATNTFPWISSNLMTVKSYNNGIFEDVSGDISYTNLRFPYQQNNLNRNTTVYINYPTTGSSFQQWAINNSITLKTGDILIPENSTVAYVYVSATEINKGAPILTNTETYLSTSTGGWIESVGWWTRSVPNENSNRQAAKFLYLTDDGRLTAGTAKTHGIVYSFAL